MQPTFADHIEIAAKELDKACGWGFITRKEEEDAVFPVAYLLSCMPLEEAKAFVRATYNKHKYLHALCVKMHKEMIGWTPGKK
jgi:hypothetical protein